MRYLPLGVLLVSLWTIPSVDAELQHHPADAIQTSDSSAAGATDDKTAGQRHYDPLAGHQHLHGGIWDHTLSGINPDNRNSGERVSEWRRTVVAETIRNFVFWTALAVTLGFLFSLLFVYWLLLDRARRLEISTNILTQIANAYSDARDHALDAIEKHNHLADDYNAMAESMATLEQHRAENQKRIRNNSQGTAPDDVAPGSAISATAGSVQQSLRTADRPDVESDAQVRQRFANQISALQEKNKTLRASLNETLAQLEQVKRQRGAVTGG